jgi:hypothetical protein
VEQELNDMVKEGLIQKNYQLLCTNEHCLQVLDTKLNKSHFKEEYECDYCGEEAIEPVYIKEIFVGKREEKTV